MVLAWCVVRRSASKFASVCGRVRSISSAVVNSPNLARNSSPLRPLVHYSTAIDRQKLLRLIDSEINFALQFNEPDLDDEIEPGINPYTIEDDGGKTVTLTRDDYQGERIVVVAGTPYDYADFGLVYPLTVNFTKKTGLSLKFSCTAIHHGTGMDDVTVINRGDSSEDQRASDLLSDPINLDYRHSYLDMIFDNSDKFALYKYMTTGTRKYVLWLKDVKKFLEE